MPPTENGNSRGSARVRGAGEIEIAKGAAGGIHHVVRDPAKRQAFGECDPADANQLIGEIGERCIEILRAVHRRLIRGQDRFGRGQRLEALPKGARASVHSDKADFHHLSRKAQEAGPLCAHRFILLVPGLQMFWERVVHREDGAAETGRFGALHGLVGEKLREGIFEVRNVFRIAGVLEIIDGAPVEQDAVGVD